MSSTKQNGRDPDSPGRSEQQTPDDAIVPRAPDGIDLTVSRIPRTSGPRLLWLTALDLAISRDAQATRECMVAEGWPEADAYAAYRDWLRQVVDVAAAEGWWSP